ncbi:type II secretion system protein GspJ [Pseudoalteromonas sp. A25]|uniref:type II secretion system minor pseudopilin GspJ n=1 Tax=Pseudoalteromonas sp. A25 TaxID=116092 RepID=UPI001260A086|nr:type II secretion system minor pseudopilin GspJ [Pseudoalteromonas sp. A25]BBN80244.1 type II secretion system protein GspJ [Pseudoalteromonas sp. A25]
MRQRGFTLLEVMVALGILAFVVMSTHQILDSTLKAKEASESTIAELEALQTTFRLMDQDFSQMTKREVRNEAGDVNPTYVLHGRYELQSQFDGIAFVRDGWTNPISLLPRSELQAVGYRVVDDNLERIYRIYVDELDGAEPKAQVVIEDIEELKFEFMDDKQQWQEDWKKKALPVAVAVTLQVKGAAPIRRLFLTPGDGKEQQAQSGDGQSRNGNANSRSGDTQNGRSDFRGRQ